MSTLKVGAIQSTTGNAALTIANNGNTSITGVTNTPAFEAYVPSTVENLTDNTASKMPASTEVFDSDGKYDTSTYRFTPTVAGKYYVYADTDICSD